MIAPIVLLLVGELAALAVAVPQATAQRAASEAALFQPAQVPAAQLPTPSAPTASPTPTPVDSVGAVPALDASVLRLPGPVPSAGPGSFVYASTAGPTVGSVGPLHRYRVAVERGSEVDTQAFTAAVDQALGDPRSWTAGGRLRLQRVAERAGHDFTIYLATATTARRMCAAAGVNIQVGGRPYTSCRGTGQVILNLDRWQLSAAHLVAAGVPLSVYRTYLVNHEVGHELGYRHEGCPGRGKPAPVMMQQTLSLDGCVVNPWPYLNGGRYAGPRV